MEEQAYKVEARVSRAKRYRAYTILAASARGAEAVLRDTYRHVGKDNIIIRQGRTALATREEAFASL